MRNWAILFLVPALLAAVFAFTGTGGTSTFMFLALFFVALLAGVMLLVSGRRRRGRPT